MRYHYREEEIVTEIQKRRERRVGKLKNKENELSCYESGLRTRIDCKREQTYYRIRLENGISERRDKDKQILSTMSGKPERRDERELTYAAE